MECNTKQMLENTASTNNVKNKLKIKTNKQKLLPLLSEKVECKRSITNAIMNQYKDSYN